MTVELMTIGGGIVLLVLSALGGGIEAKEIKVPQLPTVTRLLCAFAGIALIVLGVVLKGVPFAVSPVPAATTPQASSETQKPVVLAAVAPNPSHEVLFTITDRLGSDQLSERIEIFLEGKRVGVLEINDANPMAIIELPAPAPGMYQYRISGVLRYRTDNGNRVRKLSGSGSVEIQKGSAFFIHLEDAEETHALVSLKAKP